MATIQLHPFCIHGGSRAERLALRLAWLVSFTFIPLRFRGFWRITRPLCALLGVRERQWVRRREDVTLSVDLCDPYWNRLINPHFTYEPELHALFRRVAAVPYRFIDCGANIGYWSLELSSKAYGAHECFAIEALQKNVRLLEQHNAANANRVTVIHAAVSDKAGESVTFYHNKGDASGSLIAEDGGGEHETVETVTLDALMQEHLSDAPVILKLDVEGVEIAALEGATALLQTLPLISYEDHGKDRDSAISAYLLAQHPDWKLFYLTENNALLPMKDLSAITALKTDRTKGYNFIAVHPDSPFYAPLTAE